MATEGMIKYQFLNMKSIIALIAQTKWFTPLWDLHFLALSLLNSLVYFLESSVGGQL